MREDIHIFIALYQDMEPTGLEISKYPEGCKSNELLKVKDTIVFIALIKR